MEFMFAHEASYRSRYRDRSASPIRQMRSVRSNDRSYSHLFVPSRFHQTVSTGTRRSRSPPHRHLQRKSELRPTRRDPAQESLDEGDKRQIPFEGHEAHPLEAGTSGVGQFGSNHAAAAAGSPPTITTANRYSPSEKPLPTPSEEQLPTPSELSKWPFVPSSPTGPPTAPALSIHVPKKRQPPDTSWPNTDGQLDFLTRMYRNKAMATWKREEVHRNQCKNDNWELERMREILTDLERTKVALSEAKATIVRQQSEIASFQAAPTYTFLKDKTGTMEKQLGVKDRQIMDLKVRLAAESIRLDSAVAENKVLMLECAEGREVMQHYCKCQGWDRWVEAKKITEQAKQE